MIARCTLVLLFPLLLGSHKLYQPLPAQAQSAIVRHRLQSAKQQRANARLFALWPLPLDLNNPKYRKYPTAQAVLQALRRGADVNAKDGNGWTSLMIAALLGRGDLISLLLAHGAAVNAHTDHGTTALTVAAGLNKPDIVGLLLAHGAAANDPSKPLMASIGTPSANNVTVAQLLLSHGADVNTTLADGTSALMLASEFGEAKIVSILLEKGAKVNMKDKQGNTALLLAQPVRITPIPTKGTKPGNAAPNQFEIELSDATDYADIAKMLLSHGADVNAVNQAGDTALIKATSFGDVNLVQELLNHGADVTIKDKAGKTALSVAMRDGNAKIIDVLQAAGAK